MGASRPRADAEFVAAVEDVLEGSHRPFDPTRAQVNLDEAAKPLLSQVRAPLPMRPGRPERVDGEVRPRGHGGAVPGL